jgi:hypothetical protein
MNSRALGDALGCRPKRLSRTQDVPAHANLRIRVIHADYGIGMRPMPVASTSCGLDGAVTTRVHPAFVCEQLRPVQHFPFHREASGERRAPRPSPRSGAFDVAVA